MFVQFPPSDACFHVASRNKNTYYERTAEQHQQQQQQPNKERKKKRKTN